MTPREGKPAGNRSDEEDSLRRNFEYEGNHLRTVDFFVKHAPAQLILFVPTNVQKFHEIFFVTAT
jgi:hypothetical protein